VIERDLVTAWKTCGPLLLLLAVIPCHASEDAHSWLNRMSVAVQNLDYSGTFVYLHDGKLETMRIIHRLDESGEQERLVSLNGAVREVIRDNESVTCILTDNRSVKVGKSRERKPFHRTLPQDLDAVSQNYRFELLGTERMAGRPSRVVAIMPKDVYRYGYRFWIDEATHMLLKSDLTTPDGHILEQLMFTSLHVGPDIPDQELQPSNQEEDYTWHQLENGDNAATTGAHKPLWRVNWLPDGFTRTHYRYEPMPPGKVTHMVYSDGLASVSVYIEETGEDMDVIQGLSTMGAVNAYGLRKEGRQITAVGEVPAETVQKMVESVRYVQE
jgi:sigma-E factor negative regulatory protein RseB